MASLEMTRRVLGVGDGAGVQRRGQLVHLVGRAFLGARVGIGATTASSTVSFSSRELPLGPGSAA